jgi:hypothetical protein
MGTYVLLDNAAPGDTGDWVAIPAQGDYAHRKGEVYVEGLGGLNDTTPAAGTTVQIQQSFDGVQVLGSYKRDQSTLATHALSFLPNDLVGAVNNGDGYSRSTTAVAVDGLADAEYPAGTGISFAGHSKVYTIAAAVTPVSGAVTLSIAEGLDVAVADDEVVTLYSPGNGTISLDTRLVYVRARAVGGFSTAITATLYLNE